MPITRIDPGPRYSEAVIHNGVAYLSGQVPEKTLDKGIAEQTAEVLGFIDELLGRVGSDRTKLLNARIWLSDISEIKDMNVVWDAWIGGNRAPARATVEAKLANPAYKVEIAVIAAV